MEWSSPYASIRYAYISPSIHVIAPAASSGPVPIGMYLKESHWCCSRCAVCRELDMGASAQLVPVPDARPGDLDCSDLWYKNDSLYSQRIPTNTKFARTRKTGRAKFISVQSSKRGPVEIRPVIYRDSAPFYIFSWSILLRNVRSGPPQGSSG